MLRNAPSHFATTTMKQKEKKDIQVDAAKRALQYGEDNHRKKRYTSLSQTPTHGATRTCTRARTAERIYIYNYQYVSSNVRAFVNVYRLTVT